MHSSRKGFSVFSFLITLIVIAFGYTLVVPQLVRYTKQTNENIKAKPEVDSSTLALEKTTAGQTLSQATSMILMESNNSFQNLCSTNECLRDLYSSKLSAMSTCNEDNITNCWSSALPNSSAIVLNNGQFVLFTQSDASCSNQTCAKIYIDVNGYNAPNELNNDIIGFNLTPNSVTALSQ